MPSRRLHSFFVTLFLGLLSAPVAWATIDVGEPIVILREVERPSEESPEVINRTDCDQDVAIRFPVVIRSAAEPMTVWVGPEGCRDREVRNDECVDIWGDEVSSATTTIEIPAQQVLRGVLNGRTCAEAAVSESRTVTLLFAFLDNGSPSGVDGESDEVTITYDLAGPAGPAITSAKAGEGKILVKWEPETSSTVVGYRLYCAEAGENVTEGVGGEGGAGYTGDCASALVHGEVPDEQYRCGEATGITASKGTAKGLTDGTPYAVGVAAIDGSGNVGMLSVGARCATPQEVTDYYEAFVAGGGEGGGGYCAFGLSRTGPWGAGVFLASVLAGLVARRRWRA
jgi:hypothetical protein